MSDVAKNTGLKNTVKQSNQVLRDVGASLLQLPSYLEHTVINNGGSPAEVVSISSNLRILCSALIKNDFDSIKTHCNELEIALIEAQKERLLKIPDNSK